MSYLLLSYMIFCFIIGYTRFNNPIIYPDIGKTLVAKTDLTIYHSPFRFSSIEFEKNKYKKLQSKGEIPSEILETSYLIKAGTEFKIKKQIITGFPDFVFIILMFWNQVIKNLNLSFWALRISILIRKMK